MLQFNPRPDPEHLDYLTRLIRLAQQWYYNGFRAVAAVANAAAVLARNPNADPKGPGRADSAASENRTERFFHNRHAAPAGRLP